MKQPIPFHLLAPLILLAPLVSEQARLWTVSESGPADFTDPQPAIDAAATGDTIVPSTGEYGRSIIGGKGGSRL